MKSEMKRQNEALCFREFPQPTNSAADRLEARFVKNSNSTYLRTVAAAVVVTVHAPPATVFLHALQFQIPTAVLFTESCISFILERVNI